MTSRRRELGIALAASALAASALAACSSGSKAGGSNSSSPPAAQQSTPQSATTPPLANAATTPPLAGSTQTTSDGAVIRTIAVPWDRPAEQDLQVAAAGLTLTAAETLQVHYHAHLDVLVYGNPVAVPAGLGINVGPNNALPPHGSPGIAPLHTHDTSGILHVEAPAQAKFTLGQVFTEWGISLGPGQVGAYRTADARGDRVDVYVGGAHVDGDPRTIVLTPHEEIAVIVSAAGAPAAAPPTSYAFPAGD